MCWVDHEPGEAAKAGIGESLPVDVNVHTVAGILRAVELTVVDLLEELSPQSLVCLHRSRDGDKLVVVSLRAIDGGVRLAEEEEILLGLDEVLRAVVTVSLKLDTVERCSPFLRALNGVGEVLKDVG